MKRGLGFALAVVLTAVVVGVAAGPVRAAGAVAFDRCNPRMADDYSGQIRDFEAHPVRGGANDMFKRLQAINDVLTAVNQERGVIDGVCSTQAQKAPIFAQLAATAAWGLGLQSDVLLQLGQPCPPAGKAMATALVSQGWLDLATSVNHNGGTVPEPVAQVVPKLQSRAAALGLTLPAFADTSAYWRDGLDTQAKAAMKACPTPLPSPAPSAAPSGR